MSGKFDDKIFRILIENSHEGVAIIGAEGETIYVSPTMEQILGYSNKDIAKDNSFQFVHPDFMGTAQKTFQNFVSGAVEFQTIEIKMLHKDGNYIWVEANATNMLKTPEIKGIVINFRDIDDKKQAEEKLKFNSMVLDQIQDLVTVTDLNGVIQYVNEIQSKTYGLSKKEIVGKSVHVFGDNPENGVTQDDIIEKTLKEGSWKGEVCNYAKDGREHLIQTKTQIVKDEFGKPVAMVGISKDITEQKKAERDLVRSEKKFRQIYKNIQTGIARVSLDFKIQNANEAYCTMLGYTEEELVGKTLKDITHPEIIEENLKKQKELGNGIIDSYSMEKKFIHKDGNIVYGLLTANLIRDEKGEPNYFLGSVVDITDRKKAEEELKKSERIFNHAIDMLCIAGFDGYFKTLNPSWERVLGWSKEELLSKPWLDFVHPEDIEKTKNIKAVELKNGRQVYNFENRYICKDGSYRWLSWNSFPYQDEKLIYGVARDVTDQKKAEQALKDRNSHFKTLVNTIPDLIWLKDADGVYLSCNETFERFFGAGEKEIIGKTDYDFVDKELADFFRENDRRAMASGGSYMNEEQVTFADDGHEAFLETIKSPMFDAEGKLTGILGIGRDITDRKMVEEALKESENKFRSIFTSMTEMVVLHELVFDEHGKPVNYRILECNPAFTLILGIKREDAVGGLATDVYGSESAPFLDEYAYVALNGEPISFITVYGPLKKHFEIKVVSPEKNLFVTVTNDITEQKSAERNLIKSEEKYRHIADNMIDVVWTSDLDTNLTFITPSIEKLTGETAEENMKKSIAERFTPESLAKVIPMFQEELEKEKDPNCDKNRSRIVEADQLKKDGSTIHVAMNISFLRDEDQNAIGFIGITRDITEKKKAELEKELLQEQLIQSQKMESVGRLAGGVAHDFNNMLSVILGRSEIALQKADSNNNLFNELIEIKSAAERSAELTSQLLAFARKQISSPKIISVNDEIKNVSAMLKRLIEEDVVLIYNGGRSIKNISIDPAQLSQILTNLCINAKDADAATIIIKTNMSEGNDYVQIKIYDDGSGMDKETQNKIFEPFFTTKQLGKGTGLGLSTIYGIVKQNNGSIDVQSEVGKGTEFTICFPAVKEKLTEKRSEKKTFEYAPSGQTILLVEDEEAILDMASLMLEEFGYKVITASTPGEALNIAVENPGNIDLILTDVVMPEMNGRDLAKKIMNYHPDIKSIFMSGYTADIIASKGVLDEDMNFLQKPFSMSKLKEKIEQVLRTVS